MVEGYLDQIRAVIQVCEDTDGILIVDRDGIIRDHRIAMNYYWKAEETVGRHIRELYPELDEESSTILRALRTGRAIYDQRQEIVNSRGERVVLDATTIPITVGGQVVGRWTAPASMWWGSVLSAAAAGAACPPWIGL